MFMLVVPLHYGSIPDSKDPSRISMSKEGLTFFLAGARCFAK